MANFQSIVRENQLELIECTGVSLELCLHLDSSKLVTGTDYEELKKLADDKQQRKAAIYLYNNVVKRFDEEASTEFIKNLRSTKNFRAHKILSPKKSQNNGDPSKHNGPGLVALNSLSSQLSLIMFIKRIEDGEYSIDGEFEGLNHSDEIVANTLLHRHRSRDPVGWKYFENEKNEINTGNWDRHDFMEHVKKTSDCLQKHVVWWNKKTSKLPNNYIPRKILETVKTTVQGSIVERPEVNITELVHVTNVNHELANNLMAENLATRSDYQRIVQHLERGEHTRSSAFIYTTLVSKFDLRNWEVFLDVLRKTGNSKACELLTSTQQGSKVTSTHQSSKEIRLKDLINSSNQLVILVDPPGMGKSSVTTKIEGELREDVKENRVILRLNLNATKTTLLRQKDKPSLDLIEFLSNSAKHIPSQVFHSEAKLIVLLDGLDEVCPQHEKTTLSILKSVFEKPKQNINSYQMLNQRKVFLTARPHLRKLLEETFKSKAKIVSLCPLNYDQQVWYLSKEVSKSSELKAKQSLDRLPASIRSIMENPLMLHLFAQVANQLTNEDKLENLNLFQLYEKFIKKKHMIYSQRAFKNFIPENQDEEWLVKDTLSQTDYFEFYYSIALEDLRPSGASEDWPIFRKTPVGYQLNKLLSFGVVVTNSDTRGLTFKHKSLAEFFYAHLLIDPKTPTGTKDNLLKQIYTWSSLQTVEDFVLFALLRVTTCLESQSLPLTKHWLMLCEDYEEVLDKILNGKLFQVLGSHILSTWVDSHNQTVLNALASAATYTNQIDLLNWLNKQEADWIRRKLLAIDGEKALSLQQARIVAGLMYADPQSAQKSLKECEIVNVFSTCDNIFKVADLDDNLLQRWKKKFSCILTKEAIKSAVIRDTNFWQSLPSQEASWWIAETMTKKEVYLLIAERNTRITDLARYNPSAIEDIWGPYFVRDILKFNFKFEDLRDKNILQSSLKYFGLDALFNRKGSNDLEQLISDVQFTITRHPDASYIRQLEAELSQSKLDCSLRRKLMESIFSDEQTRMWDEWGKLSLDILPYVVLYGRIAHLELKFLHSTNYNEGLLCLSLVMCFIVDDTEETFTYLKTRIISNRKLSHNKNKTCLSVLLTLEPTVIRKFTSMISAREDKTHISVGKVSYGEVILYLSSSVGLMLNEEETKLAVVDYLQNSSLTDVSLLHCIILYMSEDFQAFFVIELLKEIRSRRRSKSYLFYFRLREILKYFLTVKSNHFGWIKGNLTKEILINLYLEIYLTSPFDIAPEESNALQITLWSLQQMFIDQFGSYEKNPTSLLREFPTLLTESEWEVILVVCGVISSQHMNQGISFLEPQLTYVYKVSCIPLLNVWLRHFGADETRKFAENDALWNFVGVTADAAVLAVELGSVAFLEKVAWPSMLLWRDQNHHNLLEIAQMKPEHTPEVVSFLKEKFSAAFCN